CMMMQTSAVLGGGGLAAGTGGDWFADNAVPTDNPALQYIFTGRQFDPETRLYFYRARYYHPRLGRFVSRDPIGYGGGINPYEYARSNSITAVDPRGTLDDINTYDPANQDPAEAQSVMTTFFQTRPYAGAW